MSTRLKEYISYCQKEYGRDVLMVRAPGRVNIIGEHIDYCSGTVLPFAIDKSMYFCLKENQKGQVYIHAYDLNEQSGYNYDSNQTSFHWDVYFHKILDILSSRYQFNEAFDLCFHSDIPIGGGLSSSTALCCGFIFILNKRYNLNLSKKDIIDLASEAEYGLGLFGGLMDQYSIMFAQSDRVIALNCFDCSIEYLSLQNKGIHFYLINTKVQHRLIDSAFNSRRAQVEEARIAIETRLNKKRNFQELLISDLDFLEDVEWKKRLRHIITEQIRVKRAIEAIKEEDYETLGRLIEESHLSLKDDYEVSCIEADFIVDELNKLEEILGSRIMGGGFGGHVLAISEINCRDQIKEVLYGVYENKFGKEMELIEVLPSEGLGVFNP